MILFSVKYVVKFIVDGNETDLLLCEIIKHKAE